MLKPIRPFFQPPPTTSHLRQKRQKLYLSNRYPSQTALRELREETSLKCDKNNLVSLGSFLPDAGLVEGRVALFLALNCSRLEESVSYEVGVGDLFSFSKSDLKKLIYSSSNIGGSTITTSIRSLNYISCLEKK